MLLIHLYIFVFIILIIVQFRIHNFKFRKDMIEKRTFRKQRRQDMAKRGTIAAQERMRLISQLARKEKNDDDFGIRDEDWDVYKAINKVHYKL